MAALSPAARRIRGWPRRWAARPDTLAGLSGLGDLVDLHRPSQPQPPVGIELGRDRSLEDILRGSAWWRGLQTARAALDLGARHAVELPITEQMQAVIDGVRTPKAARRADAKATAGRFARLTRARLSARQPARPT